MEEEPGVAERVGPSFPFPAAETITHYTAGGERGAGEQKLRQFPKTASCFLDSVRVARHVCAL